MQGRINLKTNFHTRLSNKYEANELWTSST